MTDTAIKYLQQVLVDNDLKNVYIGDAPSLQLNSVALRPVDGYASTYYFGKSVLAEPLVEVIIRNDSYATGQQIYNATVKLLDQLINVDAGIISCVLTGSPGYLGKDVEGFGEWHMIFHLTLKE